MKFKSLINPIYLTRGTDFKSLKTSGSPLKLGRFYCPLKTLDDLDINPSTISLKYRNGYGILDIYKLSPLANIYETLDANTAVADLAKDNILNINSKNLIALTDGKFNTLRDLINYYTDNDLSKKLESDPNFYSDELIPALNHHDVDYDAFYILLGPLKDFLEQKGYDGIHYTEEEDDVLDQYLIWNRNVVQLVKFDNSGNEYLISDDELKLRLAIDHSFSFTVDPNFSLLKGYQRINRYLSIVSPMTGKTITIKDIEDEIIKDLNLNSKDYSNMTQRELDSHINQLIELGFNKNSIYPTSILTRNMIKKYYRKRYKEN